MVPAPQERGQEGAARGRERYPGRGGPDPLILILGGYGTFGAHVARLLAERGARVTIAGRDGRRAESFARELSGDHRGIGLDALDEAQLASALPGHRVLIHAAGPYGPKHVSILKSCIAAGCHYVDLAEERAWNALVRQLGPHLQAANLTAVHGASSLPGISGALALIARESCPTPLIARVTLWIGNANVKGSAAIEASLAVAGRGGLGDPVRIELPSPIGAVTGRSYDAPELDLFPELTGCGAVSVKVAFELAFAGPLVSLVSRLPGGRSARTARWLAWLGALTRFVGTSGGAVQCELWDGGGGRRRAALVADRDGQRMAALPAALCALALRDGPGRAGACTAYELLGARGLIDALVAAGNRLVAD